MSKKTWLGYLSATALVVLSAFSCDTANSKSVTLYSDPALDGRVTLEETTPDTVYSASTGEASVAVGDLANDVGFTCAFVSFDFSEIPDVAAISSATLRLYQNGTSSGDSYGDLGGVLVDNVSYSTLSATDELFNASTTGSDIGAGPLATSYVANNWHELNVIDSATNELSEYHNGKVQFRIYHNIGNDNDSVADTDGWAMAEDAAHRPELNITYSQ